MTTPTTAEGKRLYRRLVELDGGHPATEAANIAAIEAEARATAEAEIAELRAALIAISELPISTEWPKDARLFINDLQEVALRALNARILAAPPAEPSFWLIERADLAETHYFAEPPGPHFWVTDWSKAKRYATQKEANAAINAHSGWLATKVYAAEHMFLAAPPAEPHE